MLKIQVLKTKDGLLFETETQAKQHVKKQKDNALHNLRLALQADCGLSLTEAVKVTEFIDYHKSDLIEELTSYDDDMKISHQECL